MCGENALTLACEPLVQGSSPRVRGKPFRFGVKRGCFRLIPACAGKTVAKHTAYRAGPAHPRVCGENWALKSALKLFPGSSPRVRGKPDSFACVANRVGLIPACAGKTQLDSGTRRRTTAHPRVCGENSSPRRKRITRLGSSPRVRGKHVALNLGPVDGGLIPACAGKTSLRGGFSRAPRAHPRVCGENVSGLLSGIRNLGSSPRVRGKP